MDTKRKIVYLRIVKRQRNLSLNGYRTITTSIGGNQNDTQIKKRKKDTYTIIDLDQNGNVIENLSKIVIPRERQMRLLDSINQTRHVVAVNKAKNEEYA